jgi:predicted translin family RNA/ssDNA-binding protein
MEKTDKSWDISREILDTGRLVLNENHRSEITHFRIKPSQLCRNKKKLKKAAKSWKDNAEFAQAAT